MKKNVTTNERMDDEWTGVIQCTSNIPPPLRSQSIIIFHILSTKCTIIQIWLLRVVGKLNTTYIQ